MIALSTWALWMFRDEGTRFDRACALVGFAFTTVFWPVVMPIAAFILIVEIGARP